jgi:hypothetical protein
MEFRRPTYIGRSSLGSGVRFMIRQDGHECILYEQRRVETLSQFDARKSQIMADALEA